ncbi:MAG: hypothetical protein H6748_08460 [Spirochaetaceae bacterium]|nr:hypothetical protein [Myxococcales bacterium]MCB9724061.1 hypothetical protein [Spirochaetaceae bacterium]HPG24023.1 hypothetical protein [Myxococcota bacterium]
MQSFVSSNRLALASLMLLLFVAPGLTQAQIVEGTLDDFQGGTTEGWVAGLGLATPPIPPTAVANAGPDGAGDFALRITATGAIVGAGGKLVVNNVDARWIGDYEAAGVTAILVDVNNLNPFPLTLRAGLESPSAGRWVSPGVVVPATSGWTTIELAIDSTDLLVGGFGATDPVVARSDVAVLRLLHSTSADYQAEPIAAQLDVDNVEAVPEPALEIGLLAGSLGLAGMRARRRPTA